MTSVNMWDTPQINEVLSKWKTDALSFTRECLGLSEENGYKISSQQEKLLKAVGPLCYYKEKVYRWRNENGPEPTEEEKALGSKLGIVIHSGKGTGKDACATWINLWFHCMYAGAMTVVTAPTESQIKTVYWSELGRWYGAKSRKTQEHIFLFKDYVGLDKSKMWMKGTSVGKDDPEGLYWSTFYRVSPRHVDKEKLKATLSGLHADNQLFILDEAAAIDDAVFEPLENTMTRTCNWALVICNPSRTNGFAHDIFYGRTKHQWIRFRWDAEESELVSKELIKSLEEKYGRDSDNFRVNVKGLPPRGNDDSLIPYEWVFRAANKGQPIPKRGRLVLGVDIAYSGAASTIVCARCDNIVIEFHKIGNLDAIDLTNMLMEYIRELESRGYEVAAVCMDRTGVGVGAYQVFQRMYPEAIGVNSCDAARRPELFRRRRDEMFWKVRDQFEKSIIQIPDHTELKEELNCLKYKKSDGKVIVSNKLEIKQKIGRSCDYADALMLSYYVDVHYTTGEVEKPKDTYRREATLVTSGESYDPNAWLYQ